MNDYENGGDIGEQLAKVSESLTALNDAIGQLAESLESANIAPAPVSLKAFLASIEPTGSRYYEWQADPVSTINNSGMSTDDKSALLSGYEAVGQRLKAEAGGGVTWIKIWIKLYP
jgi:hypothetical protein